MNHKICPVCKGILFLNKHRKIYQHNTEDCKYREDIHGCEVKDLKEIQKEYPDTNQDDNIHTL